MKKMLLAIVCAFGLSATAYAEHPLTDITGTDIALKAADHAIAGAIKGYVVFGDVNEGTFESTLSMKKDGQLITATFKMDANNVFAGTIKSTNNGVSTETSLELLGFDKKNQTIKIKKSNGVDTNEFTVAIKADDFQNNHFINPSYSTEIDGQKIEFKMVAGEACYGFSTHLSFLIIGAYLHAM